MMVELLEKVADCFLKINDVKPLVHHITNYVTANDQANLTLAIGARPIMAEHPDEIKSIISRANCLLLNTGTINKEREKVLLKAAEIASEISIPVLIDPVGVAASSVRRDLFLKLLDIRNIKIIKGNLAEIMTLSDGFTKPESNSLGVDSFDDDVYFDDLDLIPILQEISKKYDAIVVVTAKEDLVVDENNAIKLHNGVAALQNITGSGCITASLIACCLAVEENHFLAAISGVAVMGVCGELADKKSAGPGSFRYKLFDELYGLKREDILRMVKLEVESFS
ncbi:hydroxyethylthiazole kinase [Natronospora cellulosivora (SeqCode)]